MALVNNGRNLVLMLDGSVDGIIFIVSVKCNIK